MNVMPILETERRQFVRLPLKVKVSAQLLSESGGEKVSGVLARDLSVGGLGLEISTVKAGFWRRLKTKDSKLMLEFKLPGDKKTCKCLARVRWKTSVKAGKKKVYLAGLSFLGIDYALQRRFFNLVRDALVNRLNKEYKKIKKKK